MVPRNLEPSLRRLAGKFPVVTLTGPRQSGKTTLCRAVFADLPYVSLEAPDVREFATRDPRGFLADHADGAVLDEVQRAPELLSYIQGEVDARPRPGRFILTGSANLALLGAVSQSLAGRTALLTLLPLSLDEVRRFAGAPADLLSTLWTGGYPAILDRQIDAADWLSAYVGTYIERDVRQLLDVGNLMTFQTFLRLAAGRSAQLLNLSALGADAGVTHGTARAWVSVLEASYVAFRLPAFHTSVTTRLVKTPKLHLYDSGVLCHLLGIRSPAHLRDHPLRGAIFESWVVSEIVKARVHRGLPPGVSYFRDRKGVEVDVLVDTADGLVAVETKSAQTVADDFFASLHAFARLYGGTRRRRPLDRVVVYGSATRERRSEATVLPWSAVPDRDWGSPDEGGS